MTVAASLPPACKSEAQDELTVDRADCRVEFEQVGVLLPHREERYEPSSWVKLPLPWMTFKAERSCRHDPRSPSARPATEVVQPEERLCVSADILEVGAARKIRLGTYAETLSVDARRANDAVLMYMVNSW